MAEPLGRTLRLAVPLDLVLTLGPLLRGRGDPTMRLAPGHAVRAWRTAEGPVTLEIDHTGNDVGASAWGPGAAAALDALPALLGLDDEAAETFAPDHPLLRDLRLRLRGLRFGRTGAVLDALVPAILEQKVTRVESQRAHRALAIRHGEPAPGPQRLHLLPSAAALADLPTWAYHLAGVEERRATTIRRAADVADRLERCVALPAAAAYARLESLPGVGPWSAAEVGQRALGDPDAVSLGDFHIPDTVAWALAREPRADDARLLELLEPYRGQRGRVIRWIESAGITAPRRGPRMEPRSIAAY